MLISLQSVSQSSLELISFQKDFPQSSLAELTSLQNCFAKAMHLYRFMAKAD